MIFKDIEIRIRGEGDRVVSILWADTLPGRAMLQEVSEDGDCTSILIGHLPTSKLKSFIAALRDGARQGKDTIPVHEWPSNLADGVRAKGSRPIELAPWVPRTYKRD